MRGIPVQKKRRRLPVILPREHEGCEVALRVHVDEQDLQPQLVAHGAGEVDSGRGLAAPPFVVVHGDDFGRGPARPPLREPGERAHQESVRQQHGQTCSARTATFREGWTLSQRRGRPLLRKPASGGPASWPLSRPASWLLSRHRRAPLRRHLRHQPMRRHSRRCRLPMRCHLPRSRHSRCCRVPGSRQSPFPCRPMLASCLEFRVPMRRHLHTKTRVSGWQPREGARECGGGRWRRTAHLWRKIQGWLFGQSF